ncbi:MULTISPECIES: formate dehydrogenase subunit gamma [Rhodomicrobium]|uniref:formate dehydrogenase subunit gamma n=1 Tax=Rhodomicrobium TaxID=1068 RepID=UPI000B4AA62C|nr:MULTISPECIES: formate dehydrogenase subunit gamma [Rhodomicrobium]
MSRDDDDSIVARYTAWARINHWITAGSLILLALSGFALFHPSLFFLTNLFGGGQMTRILHPFIGVVLVISFLGLFLRFVRYNFPTVDDFRWLGKFGAVLRNEEDGLPEVGRYNAGQKLYFWGMTFTIAALVTSGVVIWDVYFANDFNIDQRRLAVVVHAGAAVAAVLLWIVHAYAAVWVRGTVRAMMRGSVTAGWSWRHHRKWLRQEVRDEKRVPAE